MTNRNAIIPALLLGATFAAVPASAQDLVMRRPIPREGRNVPGTAPDGSTSTPTPTPAATSTPDADPTSTPDDTGPRTDPRDTVCDRDNRQDAKVSDLAWVENRIQLPNTCGGTIEYTCQATYTCTVNGKETTFTSQAPDDTCINSATPVAYPNGKDPNADRSASDAAIYRQFGVDVRNFAARSLTRAVNYTGDMGMPRYDWSGISDGNGYESVSTYPSATYAYAYVYGTSPRATCERINAAIGINGIPDQDASIARSVPEFCSTGGGTGYLYQRRIDDAQHPYQTAYVRSLGQSARAQVAPGFVPVYQSNGRFGIPVQDASRYNIIDGIDMNYSDYQDGVYGTDRKPPRFFLYATISNRNLCRAIDNAVNGGRSAGGLAAMDTIRLDEGCGMGPNYPTYWRRLDDSFGPASARNVLAYADAVTAKAATLERPVDSVVKMGLPAFVPNPVRQDNTMNAGEASIYDTGKRTILAIRVHSAECTYINKSIGYAADEQNADLFYVNRDAVAQGCSKTYNGAERIYWREMGGMYDRSVTTLRAFGAQVAAASEGKRPTSLSQIGLATPAYITNHDFTSQGSGYFFRGTVDRGVCRRVNTVLRGTDAIPDGYDPYVGVEGCGNRSGDMVSWRKVG